MIKCISKGLIDYNNGFYRIGKINVGKIFSVQMIGTIAYGKLILG